MNWTRTLVWGWALSCALAAEPLRGGHWDEFNRTQLNQLLREHGRSSPTYRAEKPPYAVFDWDNTSVFLDVEEATIVYQLAELRFGATPRQLDEAIRRDVPLSNFGAEYNNAAGQPVNVAAVADDIKDSYAWLYAHYEGLGGDQSLETVRQSPHYSNFITKMRYLYEAIDGTFHAPVSYPWITYFFTGLSPEEVRDLTHDAICSEMETPIGQVTWTSPDELKGRAGVVSVTYRCGLRLIPEMQQLYAALRDEGFEVWVCSASLREVIEAVSADPEFGYENPVDHVIGMEVEHDAEGRLLALPRIGYEQTFGPGKTHAIRRRLVARYGYGPALIGGDSEGDQNMMADFSDTRKVLIINRLRPASTLLGAHCRKAAETYRQPNPRFLLQGRDENLGRFVPSQLNIPLGSNQGRLLP